MSHILEWLFASKVSVKITNHLLISDPILLLEHSLKDFFILRTLCVNKIMQTSGHVGVGYDDEN